MASESHPEYLIKIEATLRQQVSEAKGIYDLTKIKVAKLNAIAVDLGSGTPDGSVAQRNALRLEIKALRAYTEALRRLSDFLLRRKVPSDLA